MTPRVAALVWCRRCALWVTPDAQGRCPLRHRLVAAKWTTFARKTA